MNRLIQRAKVVSKSAVTWLTGAIAIVTFASPVVAESFPEASEGIVLWGTRIVGWLAGAILIIRRVTPVPASGLTVDNLGDGSLIVLKRGLD